MNYLIDSHIYLWSAMSPEKLNKETRDILKDSSNRIFISTISYWELSLKFGLGKLDLKNISPENFPGLTEEMGFENLSISPIVTSSFHKLPKEKHKDPFDRMLIWQAINEDLILISRDKEFSEYCKHGLKLHFAG